MKLSDFDFSLPSKLIARHPLKERSASKLFYLNANTGNFTHKKFSDITSLLKPNDLLVFNNTKVIPARLYGNKESGGHIEILIDRILDSHTCLAHIRSSKSPRPGSFLIVNDVRFEVKGRQNDLYELQCKAADSVLSVLERIGNIPIPNYFQRKAVHSDIERYQTIYAEHKGSVAAPTAGLHFDEKIFQELKDKNIQTAYLTLHVGGGTFAPVRVEDITQHHMHSEYLEVPENLCEQIRATKARGGRIVAVGTTTVRSLETAARSGEIKSFAGTTDIFIYPGFEFKCVDAMLTNFHWPKSSLLMLVSAFAGHQNIKKAYQEAIDYKYRFYSYGDAMFIDGFTPGKQIA